MKKTILIIGLAVVILAGGLLYFYQHSQDVKVALTNSDFEIAGVKIGASQDDVQKILGEPTAKKNSGNNDTKYETWQYPDLTVVFMITGDNQSFVNSITVTGQKYQTYRGIKVGDSSQSIKAKYGKKGQQSENFYVYKESFVHMIEFVVDNGKTTAIIIAKLAK